MSWLKAKWNARRPFKEYVWPPTTDMASARFAAKYGAAVSFWWAFWTAFGIANHFLWGRQNLLDQWDHAQEFPIGTMDWAVGMTGGMTIVYLCLGYLCMKANRAASLLVLLIFLFNILDNGINIGRGLVAYPDRFAMFSTLLAHGVVVQLVLLLAITNGVRGSFAIHRHQRGGKITKRAKLLGFVAMTFVFVVGSAIAKFAEFAQKEAIHRAFLDRRALPDRPISNEGTKTKAPDPAPPLRLNKEPFSSLSRDWNLPIKKENLRVNSEKISGLIDKERESAELNEIDVQSSE